MNGNEKPDIRALSADELIDFFISRNEKKFRAVQVFAWLWHKRCSSFEEMTDIPLPLRNQLSDHFSFHPAWQESEQESSDGTIKIGFRLYDGLVIEGVLIPSEGRTTACISSQAGCALGCTFCATGTLGLHRNLTAGEMVDQVWLLNRKSLSIRHGRLSNIVYMGMGEPLFNYNQVIRSVELITWKEGLGFSPQRITLSSVGVPKMIRKLADDGVKSHFALSLHAANDEKRNQIIPFNLTHPLSDLIDSLKYYVQKTGKRFTIEYLLLKDFNDSLQDAQEFAVFCRNFPVKINLIEYNPVDGVIYKRSAVKRMKMFRDFLEARNLVVNVRKSRGKDIDAACGQLAGKERRTRDERRET
ncbi:MAG: 23S rRNA (adenine(2503)-C(2))-methyltransferase RlmN [bacterium]